MEDETSVPDESIDHDAGHVAPDAPAAEPPPLDMQAVLGSSMVNGYIACSVEPWSTVVGKVGRITTYPESKPLPDRSVSVKCYMHPGCSRTTKRSRVADDTLLLWLYQGRPLPPRPTRAEKDAAFPTAANSAFLV